MNKLKSNQSPNDIYHDYYDLALMPVALGDIITWGVKSAMRMDVAGKKRAHIHLISDRGTGSDPSPFHSQSYAVDHFTFEILPAFTSHPYYSGITVHNSRTDFETTMERLLEGDPVNLEAYKLHLARFEKRHSSAEVIRDFADLCSKHDDINELYARTGTFPKVKALPDFIQDIKTFKAAFPDNTYWVTIQFRLRILDTGMPRSASPDAYVRDAPFFHWHHFLLKALNKHGNIRFIALGRLQEKPLEILRLPNVVALRPLGMNIGHEFAALLDSDLFMGSPSGFSQLAQLSHVPYNIVNCTKGGCGIYGIPYGTPQLPFAQPGQHLYYGVEDSDLLLEALERSLGEERKPKEKYEVFQSSLTSTTHRFFINDEQSRAEVLNNLTRVSQRIAFLLDRGKPQEARKELTVVQESFSNLLSGDSQLGWLSEIVSHFCNEPTDPEKAVRWREQSLEYAHQISSYIHPRRITRQSGRFINEIPISSGINRDGWCQKEVKLVLGPSNKGDFFVLHFTRVASDAPMPLTISINRQPIHEFVLLNEPCMMEVPILENSIHTELVLNFGSSALLNPRETIPLSAQIDRAGIVMERMRAPTRYVPDKTDPCRGPSTGIYSTGSASSHAWLRLENPWPENQEIMIHLLGYIPRKFRKGQYFTIQINDGEKHKAHITGKHVEAFIPCPGRPRDVAVFMELTDKIFQSDYDREHRMQILRIDILPATKSTAVIRSGKSGFMAYLFRKLRSKGKSTK